jgi:hypothetical protein
MQLQPIDYAPPVSGHKWRRAVRRAMFGFALLLIAFLAIKSAPTAWHRVLLLYWQHRAMTYSPPADAIVYDNDPSNAAKLRASNPSLIAGGNGEVFDFAKPWDRLYRQISPPGRIPAAILFLHERTTAKGERRLVVVQLRLLASPTYDISWLFDCVVLRPGGIFRTSAAVLHDQLHQFPQLVPGSVRSPAASGITQWHAGQPDPLDASHFVIRGTRDGVPLKLDGWLRDDQVDLDVSQPQSLTSPAPSSSAKSPPSAQ